jgi:hypothetical protein
MKKIFTLIISAMFFSSAFAQHNKGWDKEYDRHGKKEDNHFNDRYSYNTRERDRQIMNINREYDYKIQAVNNKLFMNRFKRAHIINALEDQRRDEIKMVYAKFNDRYRRNRSGDSKEHW